MRLSLPLLVPGLFLLPLGSALSAEPETVLILERTVREFGPRPAEEGAGAAPAPQGKPEIVELDLKRYTVKMAPGLLRESLQGEGAVTSVTVVRLKEELVWVLDPKAKTYQEFSFRRVAELAERARGRLKRRLPLVKDPAQLERLRQLMGLEGPEPELSIERPGRKKEIAGERCELLVVKLGDEEFFRAYLSERAAPLADRRWLSLGGCLPERAAGKLSRVKGLLMWASFPMPGGGRLEISTGSVKEEAPAPGDFEDPGKLGYKRIGGGKEAAPKKKAK